jgi:hypothetical protein
MGKLRIVEITKAPPLDFPPRILVPSVSVVCLYHSVSAPPSPFCAGPGPVLRGLFGMAGEYRPLYRGPVMDGRGG